MSAFGCEGDTLRDGSDVRFALESRHVHATRHVRLVPLADIGPFIAYSLTANGAFRPLHARWRPYAVENRGLRPVGSDKEREICVLRRG